MALLLRAESLRVFFGIRTLFDIEAIEIHDGDRIGLIGDNGAGKSTLLSVLHGDRPPDEGRVLRHAAGALVRQFGREEAGGKMDGAVKARFRAKDAPHEGISGGELERLRIARALSAGVPLLFADEPTTNLDAAGIREVRRALLDHPGALVLVSHDRALLDDICRTIWALEGGVLRVFPGNHAAYLAQKEAERAFQQFEYDQYRAEQARLRASIAGVQASARGVRKAPRRMGNSEARLHKRGAAYETMEKLEKAAGAMKTRLEQLEVKERPRAEGRVRMYLEDHPGITSQTAARVEGLRVTAGGRMLFTADFTLPAGSRTVLLGENGAGKTTLLRALREGVPGVRLSPGVSIGWFAQETLDTLNPALSLLENVLRDSALPPHAARALLARMGLGAEDMQKPAAVLSGGERAKAALARLMVGRDTLLLMDEPGNHLDLSALAALEEMLAAYRGALLLVTHDRRMAQRVAERLLVIEGGALHSFEGTLAEWEAKRQPSPAADEALRADMLRMRMAALLSKISAPRKGESREALEAEYDALARRLRTLQQGEKNRERT